MKPNALAGVEFRFEKITPELASEYLAKSRGNRRLKSTTVESYARDMKRGDWLTNHQGLAFDDTGALIDGHHRLCAVQQSKCAIVMLVSTQWPAAGNGSRQKTMDTVDRGIVRSLRDVLELQHRIEDAATVVQLATSITNIVRSGVRRAKQTPSTALAITELFSPQIKWFCEHQTRTVGLRNTATNGVIVLGLAAWETKTQKFYEQLKSGLGLTANSPVHHLRNYLLSGLAFSTGDDRRKVHNATAHHLELFVQGKPCGSLVTGSNAALNRLLLAQGDRAKEVAGLFGDKLAIEEETQARQRNGEQPRDKSKLPPGAAEAIRIAQTFNGSFSATDVAARLDKDAARAPLLLADWKARGWIERVGFGQYQRTEKFGK